MTREEEFRAGYIVFAWLFGLAMMGDLRLMGIALFISAHIAFVLGCIDEWKKRGK